MNTFEDFFPKYAGKITDTTNDQESAFIQYCKAVSYTHLTLPTN